ncbi:hypothetical protein DFH06DRAFT_1324127 [Mycena polygramma]|nr:hypothetical protein DFH06DRAFT_1324127 [Mycena polygramma]
MFRITDTILMFPLGVLFSGSAVPSYYKKLDPVGIPSTEAVEAMYAAGKMHNLPKDAYPDIWTLAWPWIQFFHTYHSYLVAVQLPDRHALYASFVKICVALQANGHRTLVTETPGVRVIVAAAWKMIPEDGPGRDFEMRQLELHNVSLFICWEQHRKPNMRLAIDEYIEGVGGDCGSTVDALASMIVTHLNHASASDPMSDRGVYYLTAAVGELRRHGLLRAVTHCICSINFVATKHSNGLHLITVSFNILGPHSSLLTHGRTSTCEARQSGLLRALVLVASTHAGNEILDDQVRSILGILSGHMVYRSIMCKCLLDVEEVVQSEAFAASTLYPTWPFFDALVRERLDFLAIMTPNRRCTRPVTTRRKLFDKSELQRCSTCLEVYYCGRSRQTADWRAGHRERCLRFSALRRLPEENQCSKSDRAFMRALMHRDYLTHRNEILTQEVALLKQDPKVLWAVRFDYHIDGHASIDVVPYAGSLPVLSEIQAFSSDWLARHHDHAIRVIRDRGRLTMHMMSPFGGFKHHRKIFPHRQVSGEKSLRELLWGIVQTVAEMPSTDLEYEATVSAGIKTLTDMNLEFICEEPADSQIGSPGFVPPINWSLWQRSSWKLTWDFRWNLGLSCSSSGSSAPFGYNPYFVQNPAQYSPDCGQPLSQAHTSPFSPSPVFLHSYTDATPNSYSNQPPSQPQIPTNPADNYCTNTYPRLPSAGMPCQSSMGGFNPDYNCSSFYPPESRYDPQYDPTTHTTSALLMGRLMY